MHCIDIIVCGVWGFCFYCVKLQLLEQLCLFVFLCYCGQALVLDASQCLLSVILVILKFLEITFLLNSG